MTRLEILNFCRTEADAAFSGWDFSRLDNRMISDALPWDYASILIPYLQGASSLLDMGTGGGEVLSQLSPLPKRVVATEGYTPNVPVAQKHLAPLGITVVHADGEDLLPFPDASFDLIINRHESYLPQELYRLLPPGGHFITQQVGGQDCDALNDALGIPKTVALPWFTLDYATQQLKDAGFEILQAQEYFPSIRFTDAGAVAYYAKIIEWQFKDFSVERCADALVAIHHQIQAEGCLQANSHRFVIEARKV